VLDERILGIFRRVPREHFVPADHRYLAFADLEVPLPKGQHMLRPSVVGRLLQALDVQGQERVLEVGTGSGFLTACLASVAAHVETIEIFAELASLSRHNLASLNVGNVQILDGDATAIEPRNRYHAIAVTASLPIPDQRFQQQLEVGGRLFIVIGEPPVMSAQLIRRTSESSWLTSSLFETVIDPLVNARQPQKFTF
jgi:protein-L-isoaspartate(D-aspartate) O-methyltransferase